MVYQKIHMAIKVSNYYKNLKTNNSFIKTNLEGVDTNEIPLIYSQELGKLRFIKKLKFETEFSWFIRKKRLLWFIKKKFLNHINKNWKNSLNLLNKKFKKIKFNRFARFNELIYNQIFTKNFYFLNFLQGVQSNWAFISNKEFRAFTKKFLGVLIKNGKFYKVFKIFISALKFISLKNRTPLNVLLILLYQKISPKLYLRPYFFWKKKVVTADLPKTFNKRAVVACLFIKQMVKNRPERTLFLKLIGELESFFSKRARDSLIMLYYNEYLTKLKETRIRDKYPFYFKVNDLKKKNIKKMSKDVL